MTDGPRRGYIYPLEERLLQAGGLGSYQSICLTRVWCSIRVRTFLHRHSAEIELWLRSKKSTRRLRLLRARNACSMCPHYVHAEPKSGPCKHRARAWNHNSLLKSGHFIATSRTGCSSITKRFLRNKRRTGFVKGVRGSNISTLSASLRRQYGQLRTCCPSPSTFGALEMEQNLCRRGRAARKTRPRVCCRG